MSSRRESEARTRLASSSAAVCGRQNQKSMQNKQRNGGTEYTGLRTAITRVFIFEVPLSAFFHSRTRSLKGKLKVLDSWPRSLSTPHQFKYTRSSRAAPAFGPRGPGSRRIRVGSDRHQARSPLSTRPSPFALASTLLTRCKDLAR